MAFEELINKPMSEEQLLAAVTRVIQANFEGLQEQYFFMRMNRSSETESEIIWIKSFTDQYDLSDFLLDSKYDRACFLVKFENGHYAALCHGFRLGNKIKIFEHSATSGRPISITWDIEALEMLPRELIQGFAEIAEDLEASKRRKSI
ncbi:MAG: hypothetical protein KDD38_03115 [Bdellovibrionales bacterium]|nr:hypothetical protein [Bdellovibrionales bacterium]